jgi:hypothetical protein
LWHKICFSIIQQKGVSQERGEKEKIKSKIKGLGTQRKANKTRERRDR